MRKKNYNFHLRAQIDKFGREWIKKRLSAFLDATFGLTHLKVNANK